MDEFAMQIFLLVACYANHSPEGKNARYGAAYQIIKNRRTRRTPTSHILDVDSRFQQLNR